MADVRINALPEETSPTASENVAIDLSSTRRVTIQRLVDAGAPVASQAEAEAGTNAVKRMTPLTTKQQIDSRIGTGSGQIAAGDDSRIVNAVPNSRTLTGGAGMDPIGDLTINRSIALSAASQASLAKADTAVQPTEARPIVLTDKLSVLDISDYDNDHRLNLVVNQEDPSDFASVNINRTSGVSGGSGGSLNAALRVSNSVLNSSAYNATTNPLGQGGTGYNGNSYEWGFGILFDNGRVHTGDDGYKGQNGGMYVRSRKMAQAAGGTWGVNVFAFDFPGLNDPTELVCAAEFDVHADGTDVNQVRFGVSSVIKSTESTDGEPAGYGEGWAAFVAMPDPSRPGITSGDWKAKWSRGYYAAGEMDIAFDAADGSNHFAAAPYHTPIALRMNFEQKISFDPEGNYNLRAVASGSKLVWSADIGSGEADKFAVDGFGNAVFGGGSPSVIADFVWLRVLNSTKAALQLSGGNVDFRLYAQNALAAEVGTFSNHVVLFKVNSAEVFRATTPGNAVGIQVATTGTSYASDAAAAAGGVPVGGIYRNGSALQVRVT